MRARITPHYTQLVHDACLKSFWRRKRLAQFLRGCGVTATYLATWSRDETKRDLLDRLFADLEPTQEGKRLILRIAGSLIEQTSFPDLENWEDTAEKKKRAHEAVNRLRVHQSAQEAEIQDERSRKETQARFRKRQERAAQAQTTLEKLTERLGELSGRLGTAEAGYDFQEWFYDLADFSEVQNRRPYTTNGRQIDGSVTISGTTYLVELKFTRKQVGCSAIDSFYKKVTTKADNTMGIMVSISGYSSVAISEASGTRTPLLLLDHGHVYFVLHGVMTLAEVINRVRRHASQTGEAYLSVEGFNT
ncbi:MAG: hypothetical protein OXU64_01995 [Gemmatimonadota bacterium]|nr:hypothetical protein [Gemmatimonadota bacterium]